MIHRVRLRLLCTGLVTLVVLAACTSRSQSSLLPAVAEIQHRQRHPSLVTPYCGDDVISDDPWACIGSGGTGGGSGPGGGGTTVGVCVGSGCGTTFYTCTSSDPQCAGSGPPPNGPANRPLTAPEQDCVNRGGTFLHDLPVETLRCVAPGDSILVYTASSGHIVTLAPGRGDIRYPFPLSFLDVSFTRGVVVLVGGSFVSYP